MINIDKYVNRAKQRLERMPFLFILLGIAIYFWINGTAWFPEWSTSYGTMIQYYVIMMVVFFLFAKDKAEKQLREPLSKSISKYVLSFWACFFIVTVIALTGLFSFGDISVDLIWPVIIIQLCIVSVAEELMFRGVLLGYMGIIASSFLFAIWHSAAYGILWYSFDPETMLGSLIFAFIFGCILAYLVKYKPKSVGLVGAVAIHGCYNLIILGVLSL